MAFATFNGANIFGGSCHVQPAPNRIREQRDMYPGLSGYTSLIQGTAGGTLHIRGCFLADSFDDIPAAEAGLLGVAGQGMGEFIDTEGRVYPNAYFLGEYVPNPDGPYATDGGACLFYTATFYYVP